jgi:hypothetical protein
MPSWQRPVGCLHLDRNLVRALPETATLSPTPTFYFYFGLQVAASNFESSPTSSHHEQRLGKSHISHNAVNGLPIAHIYINCHLSTLAT